MEALIVGACFMRCPAGACDLSLSRPPGRSGRNTCPPGLTGGNGSEWAGSQLSSWKCQDLNPAPRSCRKAAEGIAGGLQAPPAAIRDLGWGGVCSLCWEVPVRCPLGLRRPAGGWYADHRSYANRPAGRASPQSPGTALPNPHPPGERRRCGSFGGPWAVLPILPAGEGMSSRGLRAGPRRCARSASIS